MEIISAAILLFLILDPLGNIPIFLSVLKNVDPKRRQFIIIRELFIALVVLILFLYFGQYILEFLNLRQESISIAGAIILFLIGLKMIIPSPGGIMGEQIDGEPFVFPLAIPLIAGPSSLAAIMLLARTDPNKMMDWFFAVLIAWFLSAIILMSSNLFYRVLRERGLMAVERLMGMLLVMVSVQMFMDGVKISLNT
jgi:multiple antibiotic resistance protein